MNNDREHVRGASTADRSECMGAYFFSLAVFAKLRARPELKGKWKR